MRLIFKKFNSIKSTNDKAIQLIKKNQTKPSIIMANSQKKGKGTRGKTWISKKGNIFLSIYFEIKLKKNYIKDLTYINSHIVKNCLQKFTLKKIDIKLPNDLMIQKKKICGILQEIIEHKNKKYLVVGIGINSLVPILNKKFKATYLQKVSKNKIKNIVVIKNIKKTYEKFISDITRYRFLNLKKIYQ